MVVSFCSGIAVSMVMKYADNIVKVRLGFMTVCFDVCTTEYAHAWVKQWWNNTIKDWSFENHLLGNEEVEMEENLWEAWWRSNEGKRQWLPFEVSHAIPHATAARTIPCHPWRGMGLQWWKLKPLIFLARWPNFCCRIIGLAHRFVGIHSLPG